MTHLIFLSLATSRVCWSSTDGIANSRDALTQIQQLARVFKFKIMKGWTSTPPTGATHKCLDTSPMSFGNVLLLLPYIGPLMLSICEGIYML